MHFYFTYFTNVLQRCVPFNHTYSFANHLLPNIFASSTHLWVRLLMFSQSATALWYLSVKSWTSFSSLTAFSLKACSAREGPSPSGGSSELQSSPAVLWVAVLKGCSQPLGGGAGQWHTNAKPQQLEARAPTQKLSTVFNQSQ